MIPNMIWVLMLYISIVPQGEPEVRVLGYAHSYQACMQLSEIEREQFDLNAYPPEADIQSSCRPVKGEVV